jgi:hypothetical protein
MRAPSPASRALATTVAVLTWSCGGEAPLPNAVLAAQGGAQVYLKLDFDALENPFKPTGSSEAALIADDARVLSGRSLHVRRTGKGGYIGASVPLQVNGAKDLKIAFAVRARAMRTIAVNVFDQRRKDNTTPASPARIFDDDWHTAVFAVEDFHYNADPPDRKIALETSFASLLFHGREDGLAGEFWIDKLVIYRGHDDRSPDPPAVPKAVPGADGSVEITWQEPADNTFAVTYSVHRKTAAGDWEKIGESLRPSYRDRPPASGLHTYRVTAADFENNVSAPSSELTVDFTPTPAAGRIAAVAPPIWVADRVNYAENVRQVHARGAGTVRPDVFLFAGDSLTAATLYTHIVGSWLARGLTVRQGMGTVTTEYGAANIKKYLADARPEFAVVMYGTNDLERGSSPSTAMRYLAVMIDACLEAGTIPVVATVPPRGFDKRDQGGPERFNRALAELARQRRVPVSYVFEEMMRHDLKDMLYDRLHLRPEAGNEAAGRALRQTMDQVYFALRDTSRRW